MREWGLRGRAGWLGAACAVLLAAASPAGATDASQDGFTFRGRLEWLTAAGTSAPRDTAVNPGNAVLALPQLAGGSEDRKSVV